MSFISPAVVRLGQAVHRQIRIVFIYIIEFKTSTVSLSTVISENTSEIPQVTEAMKI